MAKTIEVQKESIPALVKRLENQFVFGTNQPSKYVEESPYEDIQKIYAYLDSKHTSGKKDSLGREKPFLNISVAARNIWFRATDRDRKDISIEATKTSEVVLDYAATAKIQDWMQRENFGMFLNLWGLELAGFNSAIVKFVEKDGRLIPTVTPWGRSIFDAIDFENNPKIEILELTESQLREKGYDEEQVDALITARKARENLDKQRKDNKNDYIKLYEIHGKFPLSVLKESQGKKPSKGDEKNIVQQMHVISYVATDKKDIFDEFTLYSGKEAKDPYMLTALIPTTDGSVSFNGSVKQLFETQWMVNHSAKAIKDQLDLASKMIFQTADGNFVGQNALSAIETGDILVHQPNMPLNQLANNSHDITALQNQATMWKNIGNEISGISESMLGVNPPSGTAWRQTEALLQESHSLFELMSENKDLYIEKMFREFIIPFIKKQLNNTDEIKAELEADDIQKIDKRYVPQEAQRRLVKKAIKSLINGETPNLNMAQEQSNVQNELSDLGNTRFLKPSDIETKTWKEVLKDLEWKLKFRNNESVNPDAVTTMNTLLMTIGRNPMILQDPTMRAIMDKILNVTQGISPIQLPPQQPANPQMGQVGAGQLSTIGK